MGWPCFLERAITEIIMRYFLIAGEASGDLHAAHLMRALQAEDPQAEFQYYGGDHMQTVAPGCLRHYRDLAYMGFIPVLLHARTILRGMRQCKEQIRTYRPDVVILVDYPGFNLSIARFVHREHLCPVFYYISPKIWAWKEYRIKDIRRDVDRLYSILPFEVDYFKQKHHYPVSYVGNPTADEVDAFIRRHGQPAPDGRTLALLPGSRRQEVTDNLSRMLKAAAPLLETRNMQAQIAVAPALPVDFYRHIIAASGVDGNRVQLVENQTYKLLSHATAALVTSGTATLETALFRVPQVVCYYISFGPLFRFLRKLFLKVPYISLVNLVGGEEIVPELVADEMNVDNVRHHLETLLPGGAEREAQLQGYDRMAHILGEPGAPEHAARDMVKTLRSEHPVLSPDTSIDFSLPTPSPHVGDGAGFSEKSKS